MSNPEFELKLVNNPTTYAEDSASSGGNYPYGSIGNSVRVNLVNPETGEAMEEVDVYTAAASVLVDNATGENILDYIKTEKQYTNARKTPIAVGGIEKGTTFDHVDIMEVMNNLLYPKLPPKITLKSNIKSLNEKDVGIQPITFTATVETTSYDIKSIELYKDNKKVGDWNGSLTNGGTFNYVYGGVVDATCVFHARVTDTAEQYVDSNKLTATFVDPIYYGVVDANFTPNANNIKALSKTLFSDNKGTYKITVSPNNQKVLIAVKPAWTIKNIYDENMFVITNIFSTSTVEITNSKGTKNTYKVYMTTSTSLVNNFVINIEV